MPTLHLITPRTLTVHQREALFSALHFPRNERHVLSRRFSKPKPREIVVYFCILSIE